jgi:hypothetical protein
MLKFAARNAKGEIVLRTRPGPVLEYWEGED